MPPTACAGDRGGTKSQKRLDRRARQCHGIAARQSSFLCGLRRRGFEKSRKSVQIRLVQDELPILLVVQHVLSEKRVQARQALGDCRHAPFLRGVQKGPAAHETEVIALDQAQLVRIQPEARAPCVEVGNTREQGRVEGNANPVLGKPRRVIPSDRLDRVVGVARIEVEEHSADPLEQTAAALQCLYRVGKTRCRGGTRDRGDFGDLLLHAAIERRREVLRPNTIERRHAERRGPAFKERVFGHSTFCGNSARRHVRRGVRFFQRGPAKNKR